MTQLELFGDAIFEKLARQDDPPTSKAAAEDIRPSIGKLQAAFLAALKDLGGARTAREIAERARELGLHREPESIRKRAAELEDMRLIQVVEVRRCSITNKVAETWRLTE
jgi:hypothetical protein